MSFEVESCVELVVGFPKLNQKFFYLEFIAIWLNQRRLRVELEWAPTG